MTSPLRAQILLADYAQESGGKLNVIGGGWTKLLQPNTPVPMGIAVKIRGPRSSDKPINFVLQLVDRTGQPVSMTPAEGKSEPVRLEGSLSPRSSTGDSTDEHDAALAINVVMALAPGRFSWELLLDRELAAEWPFTVLPAKRDDSSAPASKRKETRKPSVASRT
jgi:hypothetical protein